MEILSDFDGGAIDVIDASDPGEIALGIRGDSASDHRQWFSFEVHGAANRPLRALIVNAGQATYPEGFEGYRVCASYGSDRWFRVPTEFDGERMVFRHRPVRNRVQYAYFAPFPFQRHEALLSRVGRSRRASVMPIGATVQGRPLTLVTVGSPAPDRRTVWITARQHPGETMAEWFVEGLLGRLLDRRDPLARELLERSVFHIVPNMNPDGGVLGNLRTNAAGRDLNRSWATPDPETTPEVAFVRDAMETTGVDLLLDIHGDERNPYVFAAGDEGNPGYSERIEALENEFADALQRLDPDFQRAYGYPRDAPGEGDLSTAGNWVGERFDCLALTLEMPFKDDANHPDALRGWSPQRAMGLGRTVLEAVLVSLADLR